MLPKSGEEWKVGFDELMSLGQAIEEGAS